MIKLCLSLSCVLLHVSSTFACVDSRGHIFSPIIMKHGQNVCLDKISDQFENGSCRLTRHDPFSNLSEINRSNLGKTLCTPRGHIFTLIIMKLGQNVCLNKILDKFKNGSCRIKY